MGFFKMHGIDCCLFAAVALTFVDFRSQATPIVVESAVRSRNPLGAQLTSYSQIYKALQGGNLVRYYTDFENCSTVSTDLDNNRGGEIDYFEHFMSELTPPDVILFSSQVLKLRPTIQLTLSTYETFKNDVFLEVSQLNPSTYEVLNSSDYYCDINNGKEGSVYYYSTISNPPSLITTYNSVLLTLKGGFSVTFAIAYDQCDPTPESGFNGGGLISLYDEITMNNMSVGIQFLGMFQAASAPWIPNPGLNERSFSLYQNGTVTVTLVTLATDFSPVSSNTLTCQMNNGVNNGAASFFSRNSALGSSTNL